MKKYYLLILTFVSLKSFAYDAYILQTQAAIDTAKTDESILAAYEKWLPLSILIHHPETEKYLDQFKLISQTKNWPLADGIYCLNTAYYLVEYYGDYTKALDYCLQAKDIFENLNAKPQLVFTYNRLAFLVLWNQIANKKAIVSQNINDQYLSKAMAYSKELKNTELEILTLSFIGSYYNVVESDNNKALKCFFEAENLLQTNTKPDLVATILESISIVYCDSHDEINALKYLKKCEDLSFFQSFGYGQSNMYRSIAKMYLTLPYTKKYDQALLFANKAYQISLGMNAPEYISQGEKRLFEIYKAMGNNAQALFFHEKHKQHEDSLSRERFQRTYAEYDLLKKETTIKNLENNDLKNKNIRKNLIGGGLLLVVLSALSFGWYVYKNNRKLKKTNQQLQNKNKEISEALLKGQNIERKRVAADLHDNLGVQANAILYNSELLMQSPNNKERLVESLNDTAKEMLFTLRETLWAMKTEDINAIVLWHRIANFCKQMGRHYKNIQFKIQGNPPEHIEMDSAKALHIVMIVQEAINNAIKYADSSVINVENSFDNNLWIISVIDNGKGFDYKTAFDKKESYGLKNMNERAATANIKLNIVTSISQGASIILAIDT